MSQGSEPEIITIADWVARYEVNSKGQPARNGDELRVGDLDYTRLKVRGYGHTRGFRKLKKIAKNRVWEVVGIFQRLLDLAACGEAEYRGVIREQRHGEPATRDDLVEILPATRKQVDFAIECLVHPAVSWLLVQNQRLPEKSGNSRKSPKSPAALLTQLNTTQETISPKKVTKTSRFVPPTFEEVKQYITANPELQNVDAETFFKGFNDSGWIDTQGNKVRNWKLKLRTWSNYAKNRHSSGSKKQSPETRRDSFAAQESAIGQTISNDQEV